MPHDFPSDIYDDIAEMLNPGTSENRHKEIWSEWAGAWNGLAYRFLSCHDYDLEFKSLFTKGRTANRHLQEKALFGFFVNGFSSLECFSYGLYATASMINPRAFPLGTENNKRSADWKKTVDLFVTFYKDYSITNALRRISEDDQFKEWKNVRNILAHRATPPRAYYMGGTRDGDVDWGTLALNENTTTNKRKWLADILKTLMEEYREFRKEIKLSSTYKD